MIYFTAHTINCVCHSRRTMFRVLGINNFGFRYKNVYIYVFIFFFEFIGMEHGIQMHTVLMGFNT